MTMLNFTLHLQSNVAQIIEQSIVHEHQSVEDNKLRHKTCMKALKI